MFTILTKPDFNYDRSDLSLFPISDSITALLSSHPTCDKKNNNFRETPAKKARNTGAKEDEVDSSIDPGNVDNVPLRRP